MGELSNTATPKYYGQFREKVLRGEIPVNEKISLQMNRIDDNIRNKGIYYDGELVEGFIEFCEKEMVLTDGSDFEMLDSFKLWAEDLFGWYYFEDRSVWVPLGNGRGRMVRKKIKKRLVNKQVLIVGRGASKSLYESFVQAYELVIDRSTTQQVTTAPTMRQAEEVLSPIRTALVRAKGPLFKFLTMGSIQNTTGNRANRPQLCATKKGIENFMTNSILEIRPMRIDKLQGLRCKVITIDEWLSGDIREDVAEPAEQSASKNKDYIVLMVSSEGTVRNGPGDTIKLELMDILKGEYINPHVSIWWYGLDDVSEINDPALWIKANPNIGQTVDWETYQLAVEKAEKVPSARNDILAKRFGIACEGYTYYFTYEETQKSTRKRDYWGMTCALGADLSQGDDFCAFTFLFPLRREMFGVKARSYITTRTFLKLPNAMRNKYNELIEEGSLIVMEGTTLKMEDVYDDLFEYIDNCNYDIAAFGFDPYNAKEFVERYEKENGSRGVTMVKQGVRTESVPLGEIKKLAEDSKLVFDQEIMTFTMGNAIVLKDSNNNKKLYKKRNDMKIDNVSALLDAYVAYKSNIELFE